MRYEHSLSHEVKMSGDMGWLYPVAAIEVLPGDSFLMNSTILARIAPLARPTMHTVEIRKHDWYIPNRILWADWEDFITGKKTELTHPTATVPADKAQAGLFDYMGVPPTAGGAVVNGLPFMAYQKTWSDRYRDQDLHVEAPLTDISLKRICWEKDYFTTCRPSPTQGTAANASIEFASDVPIEGLGYESPGAGHTAGTLMTTRSPAGYAANITNAANRGAIALEGGSGNAPNVRITAGTVAGTLDLDELRSTIAVRRFQEARARFGDRYEDYLRWLGVNPSTGRLDRPEFLGGGSQIVNFSEVLATAESQNSNTGDLFGHGIAGLASRRWRKTFEEHGWMISFLSARPRTNYQDGIPRKFGQRSTVMDYWQKELEILPWQQVMAKEIHHSASPDTVFGYQQKDDEYRHEMSRVAGTFRQGGTESDYHMGREFTSPPTLNASFVECTPTDRVYQDSNMPEMVMNIRHSIRARRFVRQNAMFGVNTAI